MPHIRCRYSAALAASSRTAKNWKMRLARGADRSMFDLMRNVTTASSCGVRTPRTGSRDDTYDISKRLYARVCTTPYKRSYTAKISAAEV